MNIQTALLSVSDKTGIVDFATALAARGVAVELESGAADTGRTNVVHVPPPSRLCCTT